VLAAWRAKDILRATLGLPSERMVAPSVPRPAAALPAGLFAMMTGIDQAETATKERQWPSISAT